MPRRAVVVGAAAAAAVVVGTALAVRASARRSPRAGARVIRALFDVGGARTRRRLEEHRPAHVTQVTRRYLDDVPEALLDVWTPDGTTGLLPTVVWTHGGGGLAGSRSDTEGYFARLADEGFTVVAVDYRLAPAATYPTAVQDVSAALAYVLEHHEALRVDPDRLVLAGDSAGAQMTSQLAAVATSPEYAALTGLPVVLRPEQLRGVVLCCGYYDLVALADPEQIGGGRLVRWALTTIMWSLTGSPVSEAEQLRAMSAYHHATSDYPPTFLTGGDGDPLTDLHSRPFADLLESLGVPVTRVFFEPGHVPHLGHEYQFDLGTHDGLATFDRLVEFLREVTAGLPARA